MNAIRLSPYMAVVLLACTANPPPPASVQCKQAVVSPVSGFAECVDPRGAPVAPPPKRPDAPAPPAATEDR
jgi:hypothetical protein